MLENIRFFKGENENSENLGQKLADIFDVYIMDAFATAHRKSASTYGAIIKSKIKSPGLLFSNEVSNLKEILNGNDLVHFKPQPGILIIFPGYLEHEYAIDFGIEPFRFIHWNIQAVPKEMAKDV